MNKLKLAVILLTVLLAFSACNKNLKPEDYSEVATTKNINNTVTTTTKSTTPKTTGVAYNPSVEFENLYYAQDGKYLYDYYCSDPPCVYRIDKKKRSKKVLYQVENEDYYIYALDITEDRIYFMVREEDADDTAEAQFRANFRIYSMKKDGTDVSLLFTKDSFPIFQDKLIFEIHAYNDTYLVFEMSHVGGGPLILYNTKTSKVKELPESLSFQGFHNKNLYYASYYKLYEVDMETYDTKVILEAPDDFEAHRVSFVSALFVGNEMFFTQLPSRNFYQYNSNGNHKLIVASIDWVTEYDGKLYFVKENDDTNTLWQYDPKTETTTKIMVLSDCISDFKHGADIKNGFLYYWDTDDELREVKFEP